MKYLKIFTIINIWEIWEVAAINRPEKPVTVTTIPARLFRPNQVVFDIVYTPLETKLVREAKASGLKIISGVDMFINQAVLQFERFTGIDAPEEVMRRVVMEHLRKWTLYSSAIVAREKVW